MNAPAQLTDGRCLAASLGGDRFEVNFKVELEIPLQSEVRVVGALTELGSWSPRDGLPLRTETGLYPLWCATTELLGQPRLEREVEYKFVILKPDGSVEWEQGPNRLLTVGECADVEASTECSGLQHGHSERNSNSEDSSSFSDDRESSVQGRDLVWEALCGSTTVGDVLLVVGDAQQLGGWDPANGLLLATSPGTFPLWRGAANVPAAISHADDARWKLVIRRADGTFDWEPGENRTMQPEGEPAEQACVFQVSFGGQCQALACSATSEGPALEEAAEDGEQDEQSSELQQEQTLVFSAPASSDVEVLFDAAGLRGRPLYDEIMGRWVLSLAQLGLPHGMHTFEVLLDGARVLSDEHPVYGEPRLNMAFVSGEFWNYVQSFQHSHKNGKDCGQSLRLDDRQLRQRDLPLSPGPAGTKKQGILRPFSTGSTASTCSGRSEKDDGADLSPKPFSAEVFRGLYDARLQSRLEGVLPPSATMGQRPLRLWSGASRLQKGCGRCEDAYFISDMAIGVADGVGSMAQFAKYGADAAAYAQELMQLSGDALADGRAAGQPPEVRTQEAIAYAERNAVHYGASTVAVLALDGNTVGVANLGDSGFILMRKGHTGMHIVSRSQEQQHQWNCPYQLCRLPPVLQRRLKAGLVFDTAADCDQYNVEVQPGDLLLLFTDGFSDNLHEHEVREIVDRALAPVFGELAGHPELATPPAAISESLAKAAQERARDETAAVPFVSSAKKHGMDFLGGKPDDITVVAAWVVPDV